MLVHLLPPTTTAHRGTLRKPKTTLTHQVVAGCCVQVQLMRSVAMGQHYCDNLECLLIKTSMRMKKIYASMSWIDLV